MGWPRGHRFPSSVSDSDSWGACCCVKSGLNVVGSCLPAQLGCLLLSVFFCVLQEPQPCSFSHQASCPAPWTPPQRNLSAVKRSPKWSNCRPSGLKVPTSPVGSMSTFRPFPFPCPIIPPAVPSLSPPSLSASFAPVLMIYTCYLALSTK